MKHVFSRQKSKSLTKKRPYFKVSPLFETMILGKSMLIFRFCVAPNFPGRLSKADALRIRWTGRRVTTGHLPAGPDVAGGCHVEADEVFKEPIWVQKGGVCSLCHKKNVHHSVSLNMCIYWCKFDIEKKNIYIYICHTVIPCNHPGIHLWKLDVSMFYGDSYVSQDWLVYRSGKSQILCIRWSQLIKTRK